MEQEHQGQAVPELGVEGLVMEGPHAQAPAQGAAEQAQEEQGALPHPPPTPAGAALVKAHEGKLQHVERQQGPEQGPPGRQKGPHPSAGT